MSGYDAAVGDRVWFDYFGRKRTGVVEDLDGTIGVRVDDHNQRIYVDAAKVHPEEDIISAATRLDELADAINTAKRLAYLAQYDGRSGSEVAALSKCFDALCAAGRYLEGVRG
jgi:hypothetical protein